MNSLDDINNKRKLNQDNKRELNQESYLTAVENLALKKEEQIFAYKGSEHKAITMGLIFKYADEIIRIYAGNLEGTVSNSDFYLQSLNSFLKKGNKLKLLLDGFPDKNSNAYNIILSSSELFPNQTEIRKLDKLGHDILRNTRNGDILHFAVGDISMFQLDNGQESYGGFCSFNNPEMSKQLIKKFDGAFEATSSIGPKIPIQINPNLDTKYLNEIKRIINKLNLDRLDK